MWMQIDSVEIFLLRPVIGINASYKLRKNSRQLLLLLQLTRNFRFKIRARLTRHSQFHYLLYIEEFHKIKQGTQLLNRTENLKETIVTQAHGILGSTSLKWIAWHTKYIIITPRCKWDKHILKYSYIPNTQNLYTRSAKLPGFTKRVQNSTNRFTIKWWVCYHKVARESCQAF